jgi:hypothetical protein
MRDKESRERNEEGAEALMLRDSSFERRPSSEL